MAGAYPDNESLHMHVNLSRQTVPAAESRCEQVAAALARRRRSADRLHLEVTESVVIDNPEARGRTARDSCALPASASASTTSEPATPRSAPSRQFPFDTLKIDRSFVVAMEQNAECREIVRTVLNLAATLDLEAIAEGAETAREIDALVSLGCEFAQGYYFSVPLPFSQALELSAAEFVPQPLAAASERF